MQTQLGCFIFWKPLTNHYEMGSHHKLLVVVQVFTIKSDYWLSEADYNKIVEWTRSILPEGNS